MFRIESIKIRNHRILKDIDITLSKDEGRDMQYLYSTVIIGKNGVGKSFLLKLIAEIFTNIYKLQRGLKPITNYQFELCYHVDLDKFIVNTIGNLVCKVNGNAIEITDVVLPSKVIASTLTISDRFSAKSTDFYKYKGVRNETSPNTTGTKTLVRKTVSSMMKCLRTKYGFRQELRDLLVALDMEEQLIVTYGLKYKEMFLKSDMTPDRMVEMFTNWKDYFKHRTSAPWGTNKILDLINNDRDKLEIAATFLRSKASEYAKSHNYYLCYDVLQDETFSMDRQALAVLGQLDLITYPTIHINKHGEVFMFESGSSGENQLFCQLVGILSEIENDSLVLIDEPENSCHPEWQIAYIDWLHKIFKNYAETHFVIATHSPNIIANLIPEYSTVVALTQQDNQVLYADSSKEANGWTPTEVLSDMMGVSRIRSQRFLEAEKRFHKAMQQNNIHDANVAKDELLKLLNPQDVLRELLSIKMIGLEDD